MNHNKPLYKCFSINLLRFIKIHGIRPISKGTHKNGKTFWIFELNDELSRVLNNWTKNKAFSQSKSKKA